MSAAKIDINFEIVAITDLLADPRNARVHDDENIAAIKDSLLAFGQQKPVVVEKGGRVIAGNGTLVAAKQLGWDKIGISTSSLQDLQADAYGVVDNRSAELASWNREALADTVKRLEAEQTFDLATLHFPKDELDALLGRLPPPDASSSAGNMSDKFLMPPFSILDARQGYWQERKRAWLALGIKSEVGRGDNALSRGIETRLDAVMGGKYSEKKEFVADSRARGLTDDEMLKEAARRKPRRMPNGRAASASFRDQDKLDGLRKPARKGSFGNVARWESDVAGTGSKQLLAAEDEMSASSGADTQVAGTGTSIFDPVLCELAYMWFSAPGARVLDPFAGGSVRGIVAAKLGRLYQGIDLREEQVMANRQQAVDILGDDAPFGPGWTCGDSLHALDALKDESFDMIMSCPPYADLEVYSDDPADISTMDYENFLDAYSDIILKSVAKLKNDRFIFWIVGEVREKKGGGYCRGFVPATIKAFHDAGARLYNEAVLITAVGSLPLRAGKVFQASRKLGRTHQSVLVFCKGDPRKATAACGEVEIWQPDAEDLAEAAGSENALDGADEAS